MRDLYEEIQEYYLIAEALSKEPSSPITSTDYNQYRQTKLTKYHNGSSIEPAHAYDPSFTGIMHHVAWGNNMPKENMSDKEKKDTLHDAMHLHHHFIKHGTQVGDVLQNIPSSDTDGKGGNARSRIYAKKAGFGKLTKDNNIQYGIVKQHPHDHPQEHLRGQNYLHPLEDHEIEAHGSKPSVGASDNKIRHISSYSDTEIAHSTKLNNVMHGTYHNNDGTKEDVSDVALDHPNNDKDLATSRSHHQNYLKSKEKTVVSKTPTIDRVIANKNSRN